jgi:hypothetical protein
MIDSECFEKVALLFNAKGLPKMDIGSNTDAFLAVYQDDPHTKKPIFLGHTSVVRDSQNPEWPDHLIINYQFEAIQRITIKCYDQDDKAPLEQYAKHDFIGELTFTLSSLMCARQQQYQSGFTNGKPGTVFIRAETVANTRDIFNITLSAKDLANKDGIMGKSDPFINIRRIREDGTFQLVWKNEPVMNNLSPVFPHARIPIMTLCNGDIDRPLIIEFMDWEKSGNHQPMGSVRTSVKGLLDSGGKPFDVIEEKKKGTMIGTVFKKPYVNSGQFFATNCNIEVHPTFADYIMGGCEVSAIIAIDYTGSNGDPHQPSSLHYVSTVQKNQYQQAIESVGNVIEPYDTDKLFPVLGFGAYTMQENNKWSSHVEHAFPLGTGEVHGTQGILEAYKESLSKVKLSGPTLFAPIIQAACQKAAAANCTQENQKYFVLLILTDGVINDIDAAIDSIITASTLPLSIIIIGVGSADFSDMTKLDGDDGLLRSGNRTASRDCVQFVPFADYLAKGPISLAEEVLKEVPTQVLTYFDKHKIRPKKSK